MRRADESPRRSQRRAAKSQKGEASLEPVSHERRQSEQGEKINRAGAGEAKPGAAAGEANASLTIAATLRGFLRPRCRDSRPN